MGMSDFMSALPDVPPSALKEFVVAKPSVTFDDIGGLEPSVCDGAARLVLLL